MAQTHSRKLAAIIFVVIPILIFTFAGIEHDRLSNGPRVSVLKGYRIPLAKDHVVVLGRRPGPIIEEPQEL